MGSEPGPRTLDSCQHRWRLAASTAASDARCILCGATRPFTGGMSEHPRWPRAARAAKVATEPGDGGAKP